MKSLEWLRRQLRPAPAPEESLQITAHGAEHLPPAVVGRQELAPGQNQGTQDAHHRGHSGGGERNRRPARASPPERRVGAIHDRETRRIARLLDLRLLELGAQEAINLLAHFQVTDQPRVFHPERR
jgi:hypothetical protein